MLTYTPADHHCCLTCLSMSDPDNSGSDRAAADILVLGGIVVTMDERRARTLESLSRFSMNEPIRNRFLIGRR